MIYENMRFWFLREQGCLHYQFFHMRKRIAKQKDIKSPANQKEALKENCYIVEISPRVSLALLRGKTECLQEGRIGKERIERILKGVSLDSIRFQEVERNCCFQEFMRKYYHFDQIKHIFTELIKKNSVNIGLTPVDFKINNYKILNSYASHLRRLKCNLGKVESVLVSSGSSTKQARHFKEMEVQVKKMTKKIVGAKRNNQGNNKSRSFTNLLIKNIQKMLKTQKEPIIGLIGSDNNFRSHWIADRSEEQRLHTSPEPEGFDAYGLEQFRQKYQRKFDQISKMSYIRQHLSRSKLNSQKSQDTLRFQTQYDTQKIENKRPKSKKHDMKKSQDGRLKSTSKSKLNGGVKVIQRSRK